MADLYSVAGWKFYIGDTDIVLDSDDLVEADFSGQTWTEVDGWETMGAFGDAAEVITSNLINRNRAVKQKGVKDAGDMENTFAALLGTTPDAGQTAMITAEGSSANKAFKIKADDAPSGAAPEPTTYYFAGLVTAKRLTGGGANTIQMRSFPISINSNIVEVAAITGDP